MQELPALADARVGVLVVHADRCGEEQRKRMNEARAIGSLNRRPPACRGIRVYQETYVGRSQK